MSLIRKQIEAAFEKINDRSLKNELAYICLTGKPELQVRDKIAFLLQEDDHLKQQGFSVAREWKRRDLAVLNGDEPQLILELKATYTFGAVHEFIEKGTRHNDLIYFFNNLKGDCEKASRLAPLPDVMSCMIVVDIDRSGADFNKTLNRPPEGLVKYRYLLSRYNKDTKHKDKNWVKETKDLVGKYYKDHKEFSAEKLIEVECGESFGLKVKLFCFLAEYRTI